MYFSTRSYRKLKGVEVKLIKKRIILLGFRENMSFISCKLVLEGDLVECLANFCQTKQTFQLNMSFCERQSLILTPTWLAQDEEYAKYAKQILLGEQKGKPIKQTIC